MSRYRITPVTPADAHAYGLHVPAGGLVAVVSGDGPGVAVDLDTVRLLDRDPVYRVESLPDTVADPAPAPAPDPDSNPSPSTPRGGRRK